MSTKLAKCLRQEIRHCLSLAVPSMVSYAGTSSFCSSRLLQAQPTFFDNLSARESSRAMSALSSPVGEVKA